MFQVKLIFVMAWNNCSYYLNHIIDILCFIFLLIIIFNLYLLFFSLKYLSLTVDGVFIGNYRPCFLLSKQSVSFFLSNIIWYKSNENINIITYLFSLTAISLVMYLLYCSKLFISDNLFRVKIRNVFWLIFIG